MIRIFSDDKALSAAAADYIVTFGKRCIENRGAFDLVLSGGQTPLSCFGFLGARFPHERKLWDRTNVYWADERCVPSDHPESNYCQAKIAFLDSVNIPSPQVHPIPAGLEDPQLGADQYEAVFPLSVDLLLLGLGSEGHTASIFPYSPALAETKRHVMFVEVPAEPRKRITITPRVIANAVEVLVLVSGDRKAQALRKVFGGNGDVQETPAILARKALWFVDRPAAGKMAKGIINDED
jgi:6-phosphogluconolactonase